MRAAFTLPMVLASAWSAAVAQMPGGMPAPSPGDLAEAAAACEQLGKVPNAPMSVQACKAMLGMSGTIERMQSAAADPSAQRPGDAQLSCDALFAEMTSIGTAQAPPTGSASVDAALAEATALGTRQYAEGTAFVAGTFALGAAMGAASAVMPNFAAAAITVAWQASAVALGKRLVAEQAELTPRRDAAIVATAEDFEQAMAANPRFARLALLGMDKGCEPPPGN